MNEFDDNKTVEEQEQPEEILEEADSTAESTEEVSETTSDTSSDYLEMADDDLEDDSDTSAKPANYGRHQDFARLFRLLIILIVFIIIIVGTLYFVSNLKLSKKYSYPDVEEIMSNAASQYFKSHKKELPSRIGESVQIGENVLVSGGYMKELSSYIKDSSCSGKVVVKLVDTKDYRYNAYLSCGDNYKTRKLAEVLLSDGKVDKNGYGLYKMNNEYVYRGKDVKNYIRFNDSEDLWRIVKIAKNGEIVLIRNKNSVNRYYWDTRYNSSDDYNSGINDYSKSEIATTVDRLFKGDYSDDIDSDYDFAGERLYLTARERKKLIKFDSCVGKRSDTDTSRDGSVECSEKVNGKAGLLPVYDFMNASLDEGCLNTLSKSCQNYNYLVNVSNFWLSNGSQNNSFGVYYISIEDYISVKKANNSNYVRLVVHLDSDSMISKGKGTEKSPYIIK